MTTSDDGSDANGTSAAALTESTENDALQEALAAEHAAIWGYGVVGAALGAQHAARR